MDEYRSRWRNGPRKFRKHGTSHGRIGRIGPRVEEQIIRSILARASLPKVLNRICGALDYEIGNVVSLVSLPHDDGTDLDAIAWNPEHFGLYSFCSAGIFDETDDLLGSLEIYCCVPRAPSPEGTLLDRVGDVPGRNGDSTFQPSGGGRGRCAACYLDGSQPAPAPAAEQCERPGYVN